MNNILARIVFYKPCDTNEEKNIKKQNNSSLKLTERLFSNQLKNTSWAPFHYFFFKLLI